MDAIRIEGLTKRYKDVVAVDELGGEADVKALLQVLQCGCSVIATIHGESWETLQKRPGLKLLFSEKMFQRILFLEKEDGAFDVQSIFASSAFYNSRMS